MTLVDLHPTVHPLAQTLKAQNVSATDTLAATSNIEALPLGFTNLVKSCLCSQRTSFVQPALSTESDRLDLTLETLNWLHPRLHLRARNMADVSPTMEAQAN